MLHCNVNNAKLFPLKLNEFDHYTLLVNDAESSCEFHTNVLGFDLIKTQHLNMKNPEEQEPDMLNFVLSLPNQPGKTCVITQGLGEDSVLNRYIQKHGEGIHHVAFSTDNIESDFNHLLENNIKLTSSSVILDPLSGLKQFFIDKSYCGYFIEIIERTSNSKQEGFYSNDNMAQLASTMDKCL
jgi:methylmalonyl-CoA/ethylmalonyl-CoA epimerase